MDECGFINIKLIIGFNKVIINLSLCMKFYCKLLDQWILKANPLFNRYFCRFNHNRVLGVSLVPFPIRLVDTHRILILVLRYRLKPCSRSEIRILWTLLEVRTRPNSNIYVKIWPLIQCITSSLFWLLAWNALYNRWWKVVLWCKLWIFNRRQRKFLRFISLVSNDVLFCIVNGI